MPQAFCSASDPDPKRDFELDIFTSMRYNESDGSQVRVPVHPQAAAEEALRTDVLSWYLRLLTPEFMERALSKEGVQQNNRLYNPLVVMWLMAYQRLHGNASMERAVVNVVHGLPAEFWPRPCKRRGENQVSGNDGSYSTARQELPVRVVERAAGQVFEGHWRRPAARRPYSAAAPFSSMAPRCGRPTAQRCHRRFRRPRTSTANRTSR